jgi:hypothetical protein
MIPPLRGSIRLRIYLSPESLRGKRYAATRPRYLSRRRLGEGGSEAALHGWPRSAASYCLKVMDSSETKEKSVTAGSRGLIRVICPLGLIARSA